MAAATAHSPAPILNLMDMDVDMELHTNMTTDLHSSLTSKPRSLTHVNAQLQDPVVEPLRAGLESLTIMKGRSRDPKSIIQEFNRGSFPRTRPQAGPNNIEEIVVAGKLRVIKRAKAPRPYHDRDLNQSYVLGLRLPHPSRFTTHQSVHGGSYSQDQFQQAGRRIMADVEDRRDYNRGGGGGGYAGRKRRADDDHYNRQPQRQRQEPLSARVRRQILAIGDNPMSRPEEDVMRIGKGIAESYEDDVFRDIISSLLVQLVQEQPFKVPYAASMVLYANEERPEFTTLVLDKTATRIQESLENSEWCSFKLLLRFLACLQDLFEGDGVLSLLDELFNRAADLQSASPEDALGFELVKTILLTLPYAIATATSDLKQHAANLLAKTDIIASAPVDTESVVDPYITIEGTQSPQSQSIMSLLQKQLQSEAENEWPLKPIPRLFSPAKKEVDLIEMEGADAVNGADNTVAFQKHAFPTITIPQPLNPGPRPLFPELYFSVYADQDVETVPPTTDIAASLIRDTLTDTINILEFNRNVAARFLTEMDCYWAPGTFVRRATPFDKLKDLPEGSSTWKPEDLAVDAIFSQLLQLPAPAHKAVYYHSMITETCKIAAAAIAPSLGRAIRFLYRNLDTLDEELGYRFMDWFSHHLSNFDFRWKWQEWIPEVDEDLLNCRKSFIVGALDKEMRLSFAKRIRQTVPEEYQPLIPASRDNEIPEFKYNNDTYPFSAETKPLIKMLRRKAPDSDIETQLNEIYTKAAQSEEPATSADPALPVVDSFISTLCYIGSKSLSHFLSYVERNRDRLLTLSSSSPAAKVQIIASVVAYWNDVQPGVAVNIVDKLLNYTILTPFSVVEYTLAAERLNGGRLLAESWVYETISRTCGKVTGRVRQIVHARLQRGVPAEQVDVLDKALEEERENMRRLFAAIDASLASIMNASNDTMLEGDAASHDVTEDERALLTLWGVKWRRVFARKLAVEETYIVEGAKNFPPPAEDDPVVELSDVLGGGEVEMNGNGETNGNGNGMAEELDIVD